MAATPSHSWMPVTGRVNVDVGSSLSRALKARKGGQPPKNNKLPERDFYSFRYNFKPDSVDTSKPGIIDVRKGETTKVTVERASTTVADGGHLFIGSEQPAKEWDCVLIYDEGLGRFILEKLDSVINLTHDRKTSKPPRLPGSPLPTSLPSTSASSPSGASPAQTHSRRAQHVHTAADQLEAEVETFNDVNIPAPSPRPTPTTSKPAPLKKDPIKSKPIPKIKNRPAPIATPRREEEEESEGEIVETPKTIKTTPAVPTVAAVPVPKPKPKQKSVQAAAAALRAANGKASTVPPPPHHPLPPKPVPSAVKTSASPSGSKRSLPDDTAAPEPKRARMSPPPVSAPPRPARPTPAARPEKKAVALAFPDGTDASLPSSLGVQQSKPVALAFPGSSGVAPILPPAPAPPAPIVAGVDSEDEEWDPVVEPAAPASAPVELALPSQPSRMITMEEIDPEPTAMPEEEEGEEEEIDMDDFAEQLDMHLNDEDEEDDFLAAAISPVVDNPPTGPIMSLNGYAQQAEPNIWGEGEGDEDDYTSSDSDDD